MCVFVARTFDRYVENGERTPRHGGIFGGTAGGVKGKERGEEARTPAARRPWLEAPATEMALRTDANRSVTTRCTRDGNGTPATGGGSRRANPRDERESSRSPQAGQ